MKKFLIAMTLPIVAAVVVYYAFPEKITGFFLVIFKGLSRRHNGYSGFW
jgi:hypothetical protein